MKFSYIGVFAFNSVENSLGVDHRERYYHCVHTIQQQKVYIYIYKSELKFSFTLNTYINQSINQFTIRKTFPHSTKLFASSFVVAKGKTRIVRKLEQRHS